MKYPKLVIDAVCKTPIKIVLDGDELNENGELAPIGELETRCNLQLGAYTKFTKNKEAVTLEGKALISGNIFEEQNTIQSGKAFINGKEYSFKKGIRNYNPDGTINFVTLELE